ncbi:hypothetical protein BKA67DRAFT_660918 [Truncatella angustata]|uniref:DUF676 domain-containing protein n=1 Tax=Truncatella angustata TaxID=152316 RepID=A0A9P8UHK7_9PEZI|nr:uncharacterized protein BKA67DRAFT_660918 [Truncatella angustata]KAH6652152.1 hypothetical protein BKA67DRAFT_660918 [Truncatella angustata]KAH8205061.1 hypothetical protein TruAng_000784 [Truncatella angustata]
MAPPTENRTPLVIPRPVGRAGFNRGPAISPNDPSPSPAPSLGLSDPEQSDKRILLLVYIHGFMGKDDSFKNFPLHLHHCLKLQLSESHTITTKVYPRYKTYKAIEVARDNFSRWLEAHESHKTDVVLLGHSMGGLLSAEPTRNRADVRFFQHRILGTVNLDAPLLGLHPGIIKSGIASLFKKKPDPPTPVPAGGADEIAPGNRPQEPGPPDTPDPDIGRLVQKLTIDPNYNPDFANDVRQKDRGWWKNIVHFATKHNSEGLVDAATNHIASHMEFGSCLMDYNGLKLRYETLRKLEDIDDYKYHGMPHVPARVRFIQYYTVCYGYPKQPKPPKTPKTPKSDGIGEPGQAQDYMSAGSGKHSEPSTPRTSMADHREDRHDSDSQKGKEIESWDTPGEHDPIEHRGVDGADDTSIRSLQTRSDAYFTPSSSRPSSPGFDGTSGDATLVQVPDPMNLSSASKGAEADKDEGWEVANAMPAPSRQAPPIPNTLQHTPSNNSTSSSSRGKVEGNGKEKKKEKTKTREKSPAKSPKPEKAKKPEKPPKKRKFCNRPSRVNGEMDPKWVEVFMQDVDEVAAHTVLFVPGPHYEKLVGDVGETVVQWVQDDLTKRMVLSEQ